MYIQQRSSLVVFFPWDGMGWYGVSAAHRCYLLGVKRGGWAGWLRRLSLWTPLGCYSVFLCAIQCAGMQVLRTSKNMYSVRSTLYAYV